MRQMLLRSGIGLAVIAWGIFHSQMAEGVDFSRDVRPLLSNKCFTCHGPDEKHRKEDLRFDERASAVAKKAIVPGDSKASLLIERITSKDPETMMPPPDSKKAPLTSAEVEILRKWIDEGGKYDLHWAYVPPKRVEPPVTGNVPPKPHPIDAFVAQRLEKETPALRPAAEADRRTLIRRLSFDLIGLPPKPEEVSAFVADTSPDAYEKLVDRLLASPHFGERMAVSWLDLVRYADSAGYHSDNEREVWMYRDYVVRSFNADKPYDRFCIEQLAGDLLPDASHETRIASGYNKLLQTTEEGGAQAKEYTAKYAADRVRNFGVVWLGATTGCCECHNHKYDPLTSRDFYSLAAFFADVQEKAVGRQDQTAVPSPDHEERLKKLEEQIATLKKEREEVEGSPEFQEEYAKWLARMSPPIEWTALKPTTAVSTGNVSLKVQDDASVLASGDSPDTATYTLSIKSPPKGMTAIRLEVLPDDSLPHHGSGRAANGNFVLTEFVAAYQAKAGDAPEAMAISGASATFEQKSGAEKNPRRVWSIRSAIDGDVKEKSLGWAVLEEVKTPQHAVFQLARPLAASEGGDLTIELRQNHENKQHTLGRFRLSATTAAAPVSAVGGGLPRVERAALMVSAKERSEEQQKQLKAYFATVSTVAVKKKQAVEGAEKAKAEVAKSFPSTLITRAVSPREVRLLPRGNWQDDSGELMTPAVPAFLGRLEIKDRRPTRLDLANWVVAPENPLFARVYVNRLWKILFGQGLVRSMEDFGLQGVSPTHSELLDYLAIEFRERGFHVKQMLKFIAMSQTYRQSSAMTPELAKIDPTNSRMARQNRFRLDAEFVRDTSLAVSGLLVPTQGGPSVKPYQPRGYWSWLNFPVREWENSKGPNLYRRGLYTFWQRTFPHPSLVAFDAPSREECVAERARSNTPLQALTLLNDPTYVEAARSLAAFCLAQEGANDAARAKLLFNRALQRDPTPEETAVLLALVEKHKAQFATDAAAVAALAGVGEFKPKAAMPGSDLAAWTSAARVVLNLHETIVRD